MVLAELEREVTGMHGNVTDVSDAIGRVYAHGLVHVHREFISPVRAATRMAEIHDYCCGTRRRD